MYKTIFNYIFGLLCVFSFSLSIAGQSLAAEKIKKIEQIITATMSKEKLPGLSIAVVIQGKLAWSNGYGLADLENFIPATRSTAYRTGSIGKPMTATAVMQLVEKGKLDLDAPIQQYCKTFPQKQWTLTSRHLLAHMGGIRHYGGPNDEQESFSTKHYKTVAESLEVFKNDPLLFEPGTKYFYSTYGYDVLGCVVEGASGMNYLAYMGENIFQPAGMNNTRDDDPAAIIPNRASGYILSEKGELQNARIVDMSNRMPAGGFITTAEDLASFAIAVMEHKLIGEKTFAQMRIPQKIKSGETQSYGLGWGLFPGEDFYGQKEAFHGGQSPGVSTMLYLLPDRDFAIAFQANSESFPGQSRMDMTADIAKVILDPGK